MRGRTGQRTRGKPPPRPLSLDPDNADAHWMLGMLGVPASVMQGDSAPARDRAAIAEAIGHLEKAAAGRPYDLNIPVVLGRLYLQVDRPDDAVKVLRTVYDGENGALEAGVLLAQALDRAGQTAEGLQVLEQVLAAEPRFFRARLQQAELFEKSRRWTQAAEAYGLAAQENPNAVELRVRQATALLSADKPEEARKVLEQVIESRPTDLQSRYLLAQTQRELGDGEGAEQTARALMAIAPADVRGPVVLSQVYADRRDHAKVIEVLTPIVEKGSISNPQSAMGVTMRLASAHMALGHQDTAIGILEKARAARPDPMMDAYLMQSLIMARRFDRAIGLGQEIRAARPGDLQVGRLLAQAYLGAKRPDEAVAILEEERKRRPDDPSVTLSLATTLADAGREPQAMALLAEAEPTFRRPGDLLVPARRDPRTIPSPPRGQGGIPQGPRSRAGARADPQLPRLHAGRGWRPDGRGRAADREGADRGSRQRVVPRQPRLGVLQAGPAGRSAQAPGAGCGPLEVELGDPGSPRRRAAWR